MVLKSLIPFVVLLKLYCIINVAEAGGMWGGSAAPPPYDLNGTVKGLIMDHDLTGAYDFRTMNGNWSECINFAKTFTIQIHAIRQLLKAPNVVFTLPWWNSFPQDNGAPKPVSSTTTSPPSSQPPSTTQPPNSDSTKTTTSSPSTDISTSKLLSTFTNSNGSIQVSTLIISITPSSTSQSSIDNPNSSTTGAAGVPNFGVIAGGVFGGLVVIVGVVLGVLVWRRRGSDGGYGGFYERKGSRGKIVGGGGGAGEDIEVVRLRGDEISISDYPSQHPFNPATENISTITTPTRTYQPSTTSAEQQPVDSTIAHLDTKKSLFTILANVTSESKSSMMNSNEIEIGLQYHLGPYFKWSAGDVLVWAQQKAFEEGLVEVLREKEVTGFKLHQLNQESLQTDLGITDLVLGNKLLNAVELLKESQPRRSFFTENGNGGGGVGGSRVGGSGVGGSSSAGAASVSVVGGGEFTDLDNSAPPPAYSIRG
ncbi:hypothetical protein HDU76_011537 [Blyttiomyces sp. JEL0837]|nr:hypothetical protein HDU76_011537 [Blyttiomyces sp. JEL0837]